MALSQETLARSDGCLVNGKYAKANATTTRRESRKIPNPFCIYRIRNLSGANRFCGSIIRPLIRFFLSWQRSSLPEPIDL
jgi:hypothetical protein